MTEAALEAAEKFPHKRLVVHYMQPHYPFVPAETDFDKEHLQQIDGEGDGPAGENVWNQKFKGELDVSREELWSIYTENLEYVLEHVEELLDGISGKTVVTADCGNYVGERASLIPIQEYGHPGGLYDDALVKVPWLVCDFTERRTVTVGRHSGMDDDPESDVVAERLRDLGYRSS